MSDIDKNAQKWTDHKKNQKLEPETYDEAKKGSPAMPPNRSDLALKRFENLEEKPEVEREHSLQENARERAKHPQDLNAGTAFDWEDLEAYKKELERMDENPPKSSETP